MVDGKLSHLLSISRDITEEHNAAALLKEAAERQMLLTRELEHRIKNTLATVSAIANQTMQGDAYADVRRAFTDRLITLASAHDLLTTTSWSGAPIKDVVEGGFTPAASSGVGIVVGGPRTRNQCHQIWRAGLCVRIDR
jgi:two-component sensor histidine kinase